MRYIPLTEEEKSTMLSAIGAQSVDELFNVIPDGVRLDRPLNLPPAMPEQTLTTHFKQLAGSNHPAGNGPTFLGAGSYRHFIPSAVGHLAGRSEWYSAYTPYQPEISQGTLQAIYEYQSYACALTGMEVANASMYDGATALAEAVLMACRVARKDEVVISDLVHPRWRQVVRTVTQYHDVDITETADHLHGAVSIDSLASAITDKTAAVVVQSPNFFGTVEDLKAIGELCREKGVLFVCGVAEAMSLGFLVPPGDFGADIVVAEGQSLGLNHNYGGPNVGMFASREKYLRQMPGRLCGRTTDLDGKPGFVLTLSAREQHIRREKATSNICSNQALCALMVTIYLSLVGREGLKKTAKANFNSAVALREKVKRSKKAQVAFDLPFFNEQVVKLSQDPAKVNAKLARKGITGGLDLSVFYPDMKKHMLLATTETTTPESIKLLMEEIG